VSVVLGIVSFLGVSEFVVGAVLPEVKLLAESEGSFGLMLLPAETAGAELFDSCTQESKQNDIVMNMNKTLFISKPSLRIKQRPQDAVL